MAINSTATREQLIMQLYKDAFPAVARYISKMGGSFDDAKDIIQDALVIYYEKVVTGNHQPDNNKAYLLGIAKHLWLRKFNVDSRLEALDDNFELPEEKELYPSQSRLLHYLQTAGKKCMELLSAFYYDKTPMKQLAEELGYAGERSVTVQKYKCLEKVRETVKQQSLTYADFID